MATENCSDHVEVIALPSELDTRLWVTFNRAQQSVYRSMDLEMRKNGLPPLKWYDVLWALERASEKGLRAFEVEQDSLFEQSNLSRLLGRMICDGLVEEFRCPSDGRGKIYKITKCGKKLRKQMWQIYGPMIQHYMSRLAQPVSAEQLVEGLYSIVENDDFIKFR